MSSTVSLTDRLFWPTVAFATLALGGFGYFAATKLFRAAPPTVAWAPLDRVSRSSSSITEPSAPASVEVSVVAESTPAEGPAAVEEPAPAGPTAADAMDAEDPYKVPAHKPFIDSQTFAKKAPPRPVAPPKKPIVAAKGTPTVAMSKPAAPVPSAKVPLSSDIKVPAIPAAPGPPTYVMNDGRRIPAVKVVDMGEFWGLKTASGQIVSVRKEDVKEIAR